MIPRMHNVTVFTLCLFLGIACIEDARLPAAEPMKDAGKPAEKAKPDAKAAGKPNTPPDGSKKKSESADVIGIIGEVRELTAGPSALMVQHGSRGKNGKQPAKYEEFQIEDDTKIVFEGFPKNGQPKLAIDQPVEVTFKKGTKNVIATVVVHPAGSKIAATDTKKSDGKKPDPKKTDAKKPDVKKPADKKPDGKKPDEKKPDAKK